MDPQFRHAWAGFCTFQRYMPYEKNCIIFAYETAEMYSETSKWARKNKDQIVNHITCNMHIHRKLSSDYRPWWNTRNVLLIIMFLLIKNNYGGYMHCVLLHYSIRCCLAAVMTQRTIEYVPPPSLSPPHCVLFPSDPSEPTRGRCNFHPGIHVWLLLSSSSVVWCHICCGPGRRKSRWMDRRREDQLWKILFLSNPMLHLLPWRKVSPARNTIVSFENINMQFHQTSSADRINIKCSFSNYVIDCLWTKSKILLYLTEYNFIWIITTAVRGYFFSYIFCFLSICRILNYWTSDKRKVRKWAWKK